MTDQPSNNEENFPDKELADLWKRQETPMANTASPRELSHLASAIKAGHRSEQQHLILLNIREIIPSVLLFGFFGWLGISEPTGRLAYFASALLSLSVGLFLLGSSIRQHNIEKQFDTTLRGTIEKSLSQARHRVWMYRNTVWWYFVPLGLAVSIFFVRVVMDDPNGAKPGDAVVAIFVAMLFAGMYWLNRRIAFTKWQPEVARFEALLADFDS